MCSDHSQAACPGIKRSYPEDGRTESAAVSAAAHIARQRGIEEWLRTVLNVGRRQDNLYFTCMCIYWEDVVCTGLRLTDASNHFNNFTDICLVTVPK